MDKTY
ncbi:hypothetical protein YPPY89_1759, partial [Yersinia pestis PY-89]